MGEIAVPLDSFGMLTLQGKVMETHLFQEGTDGWLALSQKRGSKKASTVTGELHLRARYLEEGQEPISEEGQDNSMGGKSAL